MRDTPSPSLGISGRMAALFQRHALTPLLALVAVLLGVFAVLVTPREEEPQINVTMANVMLAFPGASSQDGQQQVAVPVERWLRQMQGVEHTASVSRPGLVMVSVQFKVGVSRNDALVRLSEVMDAHKADFPPQMGVMPPVIVPKGIEDVPVLGITLWSREKRPAGELEQVARSLEAELQRVPGTRDIRTLGGPGRQVTVAVDPSRLRERNIDLASLQATLAAAQSVSQSGQVIAPAAAGQARPQMITVETGEFLRSAEQLGQVVVGQHGGRPVFLSEVAQVMDAPQQVQQYVWHTPGAGAPVLAGASAPQAGQVFPAVTLSVAKKAGENAVDVAQAARQRLEQLRGKLIPEGIEVSVTRDYGVTAAEKANKLIQKLLFATGSVILLVGWALGRREAIIVGVAVMLTLTATLFASWAWGFTLNRVSLFALIFSIGILVDDAIVVVENIHRHLAMDVSAKGHVAKGDVSRSQNLSEGMAHGHVAKGDVSRSQNLSEGMAHGHVAGGDVSRSQNTTGSATPDSDAHEPLRQRLARIIPVAVDEVGGPTILATFTVIAALLPMAFVSGLMGPYMSPIPINSSLGMALSLLIAFSLTPWLALRLMKDHPHPAQDHAAGHAAPAAPAGSRVDRLFERVMRPLLQSARHRRLLGLGIVVALFISVGLAGIQAVVLKMLPFDNKSEFQVLVDMPAGTPLEETAATLHELGQFLARQPEVADLQGYAGNSAPITFNGLVRQYELRRDAEQGDLQVNLVDKHHRHEKSHAIAQRLRPELDRIAARHGAKLKVVEVPPGPPVMAPIVAEVYGPDEAGRTALARQVEQAFAKTPDIVAVDSTVKVPAPRVTLKLRRARAESLGIPVATVAQTVQMALSGGDAAYLHDGRSLAPVPVRLQLSREQQVGLDAVLQLPMRTASGQLVPLSELVTVEQLAIDPPRHTKDMLGVHYVMGDMAGRTDSPLYGLFAIRGVLRAQLAQTDLAHSVSEFWIRQPDQAYDQYALKWDGEWQITYETFRDMGAAYGVGLILIYLLVVAQFRSYLTPLIIMAPIPLTLIGVMPGHALLGAQFTATSMIGMIALAGIIVRNSILLVDFIELQVKEGVAFADAVIRSAQVRAQPIALTALAAMTGAFFILDDPIFNGLAISLIFGILVSTLLTLVVIPLLYFVAYRHQHVARDTPDQQVQRGQHAR